MKSTILTKVNKVTPRNFAQQIDWHQGTSDVNFLESFVKHCHKNGDIVKRENNSLTVITRNNHFIFTAYAKHICRVDAQTTKKIYYVIS